MVYAEQLSKAAIEQGIRDDHTYVKVYGGDGPDVRLIRPLARAPPR